MKVVALVSGGKDSCFSMMECVRHGHEIVALANLRPPSPSPSPGSSETARGTTNDKGAASEEMDSFMFQTVGVGAICPAIAECMGLPLISRTLRGKSLHQDLDYRSVVGGDEVEDLFALLQEVKAQYPEVNAVCSGAILSNYQRNRVEFVCERLGLTSLGFLWQREQHEVLTSMIESGLEGVLVKIASMGLKPRMLGKPLGTLLADFEELYEQFGFHVCGEGGEYETVTLDCPLFKRRIVIDKSEIVIEDDCSFAPCAHLRICALHTEPKTEDACALTIVPAHYAVRDPASVVAKADDTSTTTTEEDDSTLVDQGARPLVSRSAKGALVSVQNCVGDPNQTLEEELRGAMANLAEALGHLNLRVDEHVCFVHLYVASMSDFGRVNAEYCKFFESSPAPSRACVQIRLAGGRRVSVSAQATRCARDVLHVRSISSWAPVCIGPYSQANKIDELGSLTFVAGQIALEPAVMEMIAGDEVAQFDKALAHCDAVLKCRDAFLAHIRSAIVYVSSAVTTMEQTDLLARLPREATATLVQIPRLPRDALVEIEVVAAHGASAARERPGPRPCAGGKFYVEAREVAGRANEETSSAEIVAQQYIIYCAANEAMVAGDEKEIVTHVDAALSAFGALAGRVFYLPHEVSSRRIAARFSSFQSIPCSHLAAKVVKAKNPGVGRVCAIVMATSSSSTLKEEEEEDL